MTRQQVEARILQILSEESTAVSVSDHLFATNGLFSLLASNEEERRAMVRSPLFKKAQNRFRELQFKEAEEFRQALAHIPSADMTSCRREKSEHLDTK